LKELEQLGSIDLGQPSLDGNGGDLFLQAGNSGGNGRGGNIHFVPGTTPVTNNDNIFLGLQLDLIHIVRPDSLGPGFGTFIYGQDSAESGGDLDIFAGDGSDGGDLILTAGDGTFALGGAVNIAGGYGTETGGDINILAFDFDTGIGGDILFSAGNGIGGRGGDIIINAGSSVIPGAVQIGPVANTLEISDSAIVVIENGFIQLIGSASLLEITPNPTSIISYNGETLIRSKSDVFVPDVDDITLVTIANQYERVRELQNTLNALVNALSQCQHGLFQTFDGLGNPRDCALLS